MANEKRYTFVCPDIPQRSFKYFVTLKHKKKLCDVTLRVGAESICAHRIIIGSVIPYFRDIFNAENYQGNIQMPDVEPNALKCLIEFAYTCEVKIDAENVSNMLTAACYLGVDVVRDACCDFLDELLECHNVLNIRQLAESVNCDELLECTDSYIRRNFEQVSQTAGFLQCSSAYLQELIGKDDIHVGSEEKLFEAVLKWVKGCPEKRTAELPNLMRQVRMPLLKPLYLAKIVEREDIIRSSVPCRDVIDEARNYIMFPELRTSLPSFVGEPRKSTKIFETSETSGQTIFKLCVELKFTAHQFDLANEKWNNKQENSFFVNSGTSAEVQKKMYFFCDNKTVEYNPADNACKNQNAMPTPRTYATAAALKNQIYVCGGKTGSLPSDAAECFNPEKNTWTKMRSMKLSCWGSSSVPLGDYIFVFGGAVQNSVYDGIQRYDPVLGKWKFMSPLLSKRCFAGAAALNGKIYICGGYVPVTESSFGVSATAEMYDPIQNRSTFIPPMTNPRALLTLLPFNSKLYALGGTNKGNDTKVFKSADVYSPEDDEWTVNNTDGEWRVSAAVMI